MSKTGIFIHILWILVLIELAACKSVTHHKVYTDINGEKETKSWTSVEDESNDESSSILNDNSAGHQGQNPDVETINTFSGWHTIPVKNEDLIKHAAMNGMDPAAVSELLKTKQPVITTTTDEQGLKLTTTYKLEPDGSISRNSVTEYKPVIINSRTGTLSLDEHKTNAIRKVPAEVTLQPKAPVSIDNIDKNEKAVKDIHSVQSNIEWSAKIPVTKSDEHQNPSSQNNLVWSSNALPEVVDKKPNSSYHSWSKSFDSHTPDWVKLPKSWNPNEWHSKPFFSTSQNPSAASDIHKSPFDSIDANTPGSVTKTYVDDNGRTVTTTYTVQPTKWTTNVFNYPAEKWYDIKTTTPLPSLDEFVKNSASTEPLVTGKVHRDNRNVDDTTTVTTIPVENLPIAEILQNSKPVNEDFLRNWPEDLQPTLHTEFINPIKIENIPMNRESVHNTISLTKNVRTNSIPTAADLDSDMLDILRKAGIDPEDIKSIDGDTITKTRTEPGGKVVTTKYKVRKIPPTEAVVTFNSGISPQIYQPFKPFYAEPKSSNHFSHTQQGAQFPTFNSYPHTAQSGFENHFGTADPFGPQATNTGFSTHPFNGKKNSIAEFLAKVGLTAEDILAQNGELIKTIIDDEGRVLTATFVLSSVRGLVDEEENKDGMANKPLK